LRKKYHLQSQKESIKLLSALFGNLNTDLPTNQFSAKLEVCEEMCFGVDNWLDIGEINLHPGANEPGDENHYAPIERALKVGAYGWKVPQFNKLLSAALDLMVSNAETGNEKAKQQTPQRQREKFEPKTKRALEAIVNVAIRCGLAHPIFDAACVMDMPFKQPTTVVADTNSVLQGGLDFVVRFLYPMARIKIPAIVHMEILHKCDRYFTQRRPKKIPNLGTLLFDHVQSQGGQRVLLRLELQTDAEIERPRVGADPLRGIFQPRERLSPDHKVMLLTSDQGLARMTLGKGMQPLFFDTNHLHDLFGSILSGTCFRPFVSSLNSEWLYFVPLTELLWEFAVTFGSARFRQLETGAIFEVSAIGEGRTWNPYHAKDDLLWVRWEKLGSDDSQSEKVEQEYINAEKKNDNSNRSSDNQPTRQPTVCETASFVGGSYSFSLSSMLHFLSFIQEKSSLTQEEGMSILGITNIDYFARYPNFLLAGGFLKQK
jgi:hypothetical protein